MRILLRNVQLLCGPLFFAICLCAGAIDAQARNIGFLSTGERADPGIVNYLTSRGHIVTSLDPISDNPGATQALADANDVVLISETIMSGNSVYTDAETGNASFHLQHHPGPVVSWESFMWDDAKWVEQFGVQAPQLEIFNVDASHPLAAGLGGTVAVYNDESPRSVSYGTPGPDAQIVATADAAGDNATLFMYSAGDQLIDGSVTPGIRIGFFFGQSADAPNDSGPAFSIYNPNALALLDAAVAIPEPSTLVLGLLGFVPLALRRRHR